MTRSNILKLLLVGCLTIIQYTFAAGPSYNCHKVESGSIEEMICQDKTLSALDNKLSDVYIASKLKANNEHPPVLKAEQRGWIKSRNECWKSINEYECVREAYKLRIAELQAKYRLVKFTGPINFFCDNTLSNEIVVTYFSTNPPTLIAERGDSVSLMYLQPSASGTKYQGRNETLWEHQGEAIITWGYDMPEMECRTSP